MKIVKPVKVPVLTRVVEVARRPRLHVAAMLGFPIDSPRALFDEMAFWAMVSAELGELGVVDEGVSKGRAEMLVAGSFHAPGGEPIAASFVRVKVGAIDKRLAVLGDRFWQGQVSTPPVPMTSMRVDWAHAFGGPKHDRNPYGKGIEAVTHDGQSRVPLPNVEPYGALLRSPGDRPEPAGFAPMDVTFSERRARSGTYDQRWLETTFPGLPADAQPTFWNVAPSDQWIEGFFRGDEELLVENMHPTRPRLAGRLPGLTTRCFVTHRASDRLVEIAMRCDTVCVLPGAQAAVVVFHGSREIASDDAGDVANLVVACEDPAAPRALEHYERALARRLDKDNAAVASLSDSDLMPARETGVAPNLEQTDVERWTRSDGIFAKNARRGQERRYEQALARGAAAGIDTSGFPKLPPVEEPPVDDPDALAEFMDRRRADADKALAGMAEKRAAAEARSAEIAKSSGMEAAVAAEKTDGAGPPKMTAARTLGMLEGMAAAARARGQVLFDVEQRLADPELRPRLEAEERKLRELYRLTAHARPAASVMDDDAAEHARALVRIAHDAKESLAGRDLTGATLSGMSLRGIDLAGAMLESADLGGCDLSEANLAGAVLAKADLRGADLRRARLAGANLGGAQLAEAKLAGADLEGAILARAELGGAELAGATLIGVDWMEARFDGVDLSGAKLAKSIFLKADLTRVRFASADLEQASFVECTLDGADFGRASMRKATFVACKGRGVSFRDGQMPEAVVLHGSALPGADFTGVVAPKLNLRGTDVTGARFDGAELGGADLSECDVSGGSVERARLRGAMLIRTTLTNASLKGADLMDALASKSRLAGADFTGANLHRADLSRVVGDARTTFADAEIGHVRFLPKADVPPEGT